MYEKSRYRNCGGYYKEPYQQYTIAELLVRQSQGKFLTPHEKKRVSAYASEQRKKNLLTKKHK